MKKYFKVVHICEHCKWEGFPIDNAGIPKCPMCGEEDIIGVVDEIKNIDISRLYFMAKSVHSFPEFLSGCVEFMFGIGQSVDVSEYQDRLVLSQRNNLE